MLDGQQRAPYGLDTSVSESVPRSKSKQLANRYRIQISPTYMENMLKGFRGKGAAEFFRQRTDELWDPPFSELSAAEYGAFRRILAMFARSKMSLKERTMVVTAKELKMHGISMHVMKQLCAKLMQIEISLLADSGEIKDLNDT